MKNKFGFDPFLEEMKSIQKDEEIELIDLNNKKRFKKIKEVKND